MAVQSHVEQEIGRDAEPDFPVVQRREGCAADPVGRGQVHAAAVARVAVMLRRDAIVIRNLLAESDLINK